MDHWVADLVALKLIRRSPSQVPCLAQSSYSRTGR
jgi:hypothetical protein